MHSSTYNALEYASSAAKARTAYSQAVHMFPEPNTNWNLETMPWQLATINAPQPDGVMQFGHGASMQEMYPLHIKRKLPFSEPCLPIKKHITEERIAASFSGLNISDEHMQNVPGTANTITLIQGGLPSDDTPSTSTGKTDLNLNEYPAYQQAAQNYREYELQQKLRNAHHIVLCDEVRQMDNSSCTTIPEILLPTVPRPCTALIPWQPPPINAVLLSSSAGDVNQLVSSLSSSNNIQNVGDDDFEQYSKNNNTRSVNLSKSEDRMDEDL